MNPRGEHRDHDPAYRTGESLVEIPRLPIKGNGVLRAGVLQRFHLFGMMELLATYFELTKPRLVSLVLLSAVVGFCLASRGTNNGLLLYVLCATGLVASGSMALNQYWERDVDALMTRTQNRPITSGRMEPHQALWFGLSLSLFGFVLFISLDRPVSALLALLTELSYLAVYTPLKKKTSLATIAGAVPGALPPIIGWTAAGGKLHAEAAVLFLILFFWQLPHFLSIAWMCRSDYARAKLPTLSVLDTEGGATARQMILNVCALVPVSLLPTLFGITGTAYFFGAFVLGFLFSAVIAAAAFHLETRARWVLRASVVYLTILLMFMVLDRV